MARFRGRSGYAVAGSGLFFHCRGCLLCWCSRRPLLRASVMGFCSGLCAPFIWVFCRRLDFICRLHCCHRRSSGWGLLILCRDVSLGFIGGGILPPLCFVCSLCSCTPVRYGLAMWTLCCLSLGFGLSNFFVTVGLCMRPFGALFATLWTFLGPICYSLDCSLSCLFAGGFGFVVCPFGAGLGSGFLLCRVFGQTPGSIF